MVCICLLQGCASRSSKPEAVPTPVEVELQEIDTHAALPSVFVDDEQPVLQTRYSISVDDAPLVDVLTSISERAGLILEMRSRPTVKVSVRLLDRPIEQALEIILAGCSCRHSLSENRLLILPDEPFSQSYAVDYLNVDRELIANLAIATRVGNLSSASVGGDNRGNASRTGVTSDSRINLWQSIDLGIRGLLQIKADDSRVQVNSAAGMVIVHGRHNEHQVVVDYLARLQSRMRRQVSIEAQVIEIELDESHAAGVDWRQVAQGSGFSWLQYMSSGFSDLAQASGAVLQYSGSKGSSKTNVLVHLLEEYGDVRVISAPRVVALNNQPSVLSVVENKVYFSSSVKRNSTTDEATITESVETAIHTVPVGLVMQVTPQISVDGEVVMSIRPTISRVSGYVNDPNPSLASSGVVSRIPEIQVRELETVLRVDDGVTVVLGGMMQVHDSNNQQRVPLLHSLPVLGKLFKNHHKVSKQAELLILLTPTVLSSGLPL